MGQYFSGEKSCGVIIHVTVGQDSLNHAPLAIATYVMRQLKKTSSTIKPYDNRAPIFRQISYFERK